MTPNFPAAAPEIPVSDLRRATAYYERSLGFEIDWADEDLGLAGVSRGECRLFLSTPDFRSIRRNSAPVLIWLNLASNQEVDELFEAWTASGASLVSKPESKPYGLHEFVAQDPDGNFFRIFHDFGTAGAA